MAVRAFRLAWAVFVLSALACSNAKPPAKPPPAAPPRVLTVCDRGAEPPAVPADKVAKSFHDFSARWIDKMRALNGRRSGSGAQRNILGGFEAQVKTTGNAQAPYVGILRYCEQTLGCGAQARTPATVCKSSVVTEIFRFQGGKWVY